MLKDVVPVTARGERGMTYIMDESHVATFVEREVADLVAAGYVRLIVTDHVPTRVVGDRLRGRRAPAPPPSRERLEALRMKAEF